MYAKRRHWIRIDKGATSSSHSGRLQRRDCINAEQTSDGSEPLQTCVYLFETCLRETAISTFCVWMMATSGRKAFMRTESFLFVTSREVAFSRIARLQCSPELCCDQDNNYDIQRHFLKMLYYTPFNSHLQLSSCMNRNVYYSSTMLTSI